MKQSFPADQAFVGVDVAGAELVAHVYGTTRTVTVANERRGILTWLKSLPPHAVIAMEATGNCHDLLLSLAQATGRTCYLLNPKDVRHYASGTGMRSKTDRVDAMLIARYIAKEHSHLHIWQPASAAAKLLSQLLTRRATQVGCLTTIKASMAGLSITITELEDAVTSLKRLIARIDKEIERALTDLPNGAVEAARLREIPGIGPLTSAILTNLFLRVPFARADAVVAFAGLDPRANDSGNKKGSRRLTKRGSGELRRLLYNAAMSAARTAVWMPLYQRELAKGLSTTASLNILARRILRVAFSVFKNGVRFNPAIIQKNACVKP